MGIERHVLLNAVAQTGASTPIKPNGEKKTFDVIITNTATVQIQVSNDSIADTTPGSVTWQTIATITATGAYSNDEAWASIRANVSSYTSGDVTVRMGVSQ